MQAARSLEIPLPVPQVVLSADGSVAVALEAGALRFVAGAPLLAGVDVVAVAVLDGAIWAVAHAATGCALHRLDTSGVAIASPVALGELGDDVTIRATRDGARLALIEGSRSLEVSEHAGELAVIELGKRLGEPRLLLAGRGIVERFGQSIVAAGSTPKLPTLGLPVDAMRMKVRSGATVLDGAAAVIELVGKDGAHVLVYDLRKGTLRSRVRLGSARVMATAERASVVLFGRHEHVVTLDLRENRCTAERVLPADALALATDADAMHFIVADENGCRITGADLAAAAPVIEEIDEIEEIKELDDVPAPSEEQDAPVEVEEIVLPAPAAEPPSIGRTPTLSPDEIVLPAFEGRSTNMHAAPSSGVTHAVSSADGVAHATTSLVGVVPPAALSCDEIASYLEDLYQLVGGMCLVRATRLEDERLSPAARVANALSDTPPVIDEPTTEAFSRFSMWSRAGVPHVDIAAELGLSKKATAILMVVAAPQLWSETARAYAALATAGRPLVDEMLVGDLLGVERSVREELARELDAGAPLIASGAITRGEGPRMFASLTVHDGVIARLRGNATAPIGTVAAIAQIADRIPTITTWSSLVLTPELDASLRELVARIRMRDTVLGTWGMSDVARVRGVTALFRGLPGTGKSLAAAVIAGALGLPLYRVDVSRVFSKWVGETERNLGALLDAAEDGKFVLLFDEADSLFGKRKDNGGSNDRYANLEVNYLLQRLDRFNGIAILTTNFGTAIDPAFQRRLSLDLTFPAPDEDARLALWRGHIPAKVPTEGNLELGALAAEYPLSGGYIRNICLRACFLAASTGAALRASHLRRAVELEYFDRGKLSATGSL